MILGSLNLVADRKWSSDRQTRKGRNDQTLEEYFPSQQTRKSVFVFDEFPCQPTSTNDDRCTNKSLTNNANTCDKCMQRKVNVTSHWKYKTEADDSRRVLDWSDKTVCKNSQGLFEKSPSARSSGYVSCSSVTSSPPRLHEDTFPVIITTSDEYNLFIDPSYFNVTLKKQTTPTCCSIFNQTLLRTTDGPGGRIHAVVFTLNSDPDYFLTTNRSRELEIQIFRDGITKETTDSRVFLVHETCKGVSFIQPSEHKDVCLHHIDTSLTLRKFDLNSRPPEEFFFNVTRVNVGHVTSDLSSDGCSEPTEVSSTEGTDKYTCFTTASTTCCGLTRPKGQGDVKTDLPGHFGKYTVNVTSQRRHDDSDKRHADNIECIVTATAEVKLRQPPEQRRNKEANSHMRSSLYNVVAMTGSCFGFGRKEVFSKKVK